MTDSLADIAYSKVKSKLIFHEIKAGEAVDELALARDLDLSRTPVREAVQRLAQEGLLRIIPRKGILATELTLDLMRQVFEARTPCEVQIVRLAAKRATASQIAEMEEAFRDVDEFITNRDFRSLLEADRKFHTVLAQAAGNQLLMKMFELTYSLGARFWYLTLPERDPAEIRAEVALHIDLLDAVKRRDPDAAAAALTNAIESFPERVSISVRGGS